MPLLLENATTDGNGTVVDWPGNRGGELQIDGTWDGATVTIKGSLDGGTTYTAPPESIGEFTESTFETLNLHAVCKVRATVSSAGASTDLTARID